MTYKLNRAFSFRILSSSEWSKFEFKIDNFSIYLSDEEFAILKEYARDNEYNYEKIPNVIQLDRSPALLQKENKINKKFIDNYTQYINDNFYIGYVYEKIE